MIIRSAPLALWYWRRLTLIFFAIVLCLTTTASGAIVIGVIGDYASGTTNEQNVANLVKSWSPDFIMTVGDNNYSDAGGDGDATTIDPHVGQFFHEYIYPYAGAFGMGATSNRFFPCVGNHDYQGYSLEVYTNYFTLAGNERYYNYRYGNVEIFCVNANTAEQDGYEPASMQGQWLYRQLTNSTALWRLVYFHESPYSSGTAHGDYTHQSDYMRWPFKQWGATAVLSGHDHIYERLYTNGLPYIINGIGGGRVDGFASQLSAGSLMRYNSTYGAVRIDATETNITFRLINWLGTVIDTYTLEALPARLEASFKEGALQVRLAGSTNQNYITEASTDFQSWTPISTNDPAAGSVVVTDPQAGGLPYRFYRARIGH